MTPRNFPPADQCDPEDLDAIADIVVRDPRASYDLAGSREHIEALCRRYQALAQDLSAAEGRAAYWASLAGSHKGVAEKAERDNRALQERLAAMTNERDSAHTEIRALQSTLDAERNERQGEVLQAEADRERADTAQSVAEIFETTSRALLTIVDRPGAVDLAELVRAVDGRVARALVRERQVTARLTQQFESMALLLDRQRETREANDRIRSAFASAVPAICDGVTVEDLNHQLDAELAAHPDVGPLHHAHDQRDHQENTTP